MNSTTSVDHTWTNNLSVDEVAPSERENLCNLLSAILLDFVADHIKQLRSERCCGCKVNHPSQRRHKCLMMTNEEGWHMYGEEAIRCVHTKNIIWKAFLEPIRVTKLDYHPDASLHYTNLWKNYTETLQTLMHLKEGSTYL
ncbi:Hypothetical predicted protein, partial [Paramuricea clavata]